MINIWATYCPNCMKEMPELAKLDGQYANEGFQVVGIVTDVFDSEWRVSEKQVQTANEIVQKLGAHYTHIVPDTHILSALSEVDAVPTTIFVDENGNQVGENYVGARSEKQWSEIIDSLLAEVQN